MTVPFRHALAQGPALAALGRVAMSGLSTHQPQHWDKPGPWIEARLAPRPQSLVRDYIRHVGGDPGSYRGRLPAHMFPQWGFPLGAKALLGLGYPLARAVNGGCRIENRAPLPADEPLDVRARIETIDDDGKRAIITQRVITGTATSPEALVADMRAFIPLGERKADGSERKPSRPRPTVPANVHEIAYLSIREDAGLDFAKLTGDFNPIHWLKPYARAAGFRSVILHGFSTVARAMEALHRGRFAGDTSRVAIFDARLSRPLVLPGKVGVYVRRAADGVGSPGRQAGEIWVGDAPGGGAYLEGKFETEAPS